MQKQRKDVDDELERIATLKRPELVEMWEQLYKMPPPARIRENFLRGGIAYKIQELAYGGLKPATRRYLERIAAGKQAEVLRKLNPGVRLIREWHGLTHEVLVLDKGFRYREKEYKSLSEIAGIITGTRWSGPVFFGLKKREVA